MIAPRKIAIIGRSGTSANVGGARNRVRAITIAPAVSVKAMAPLTMSSGSALTRLLTRCLMPASRCHGARP